MSCRVGAASAAGLLLAALALQLRAAAPDPASISTSLLPEGKERALLIQRCAVCHPIEQVVATKRGNADWERQVTRMVGFGAMATEAEQDQLLDYLERNFSNGAD